MGYTLSSVAITLIFSSAPSKLVPLLAVNLTLSYWVDKIAIPRVYSKPKQLPDATVLVGHQAAPQFTASCRYRSVCFC